MSVLKKTPLFFKHLQLNAKMGVFAGWQVPLFYTSILNEYKHCRQKAALFDISHMGEFIFEGDIRNSGIEQAVTPWLEKIPVGMSRYGFILNKDGGVIDDLVISKIKSDKLLLVVNAASESIDFKILKERISEGKLENISAGTAKIDLQGPLAKEVLSEVLGFRQTIAYFGLREFNYKGNKILISRTGYTGELGYEIFMPAEFASLLWDEFVGNGKVKPAGFGARDVLRLEMGYNLLGNDLGEGITPVEAGLAKFIKFNKKFTGRSTLLKEKDKGVEKTRVAFSSLSKKIPRRSYKIYDRDKEIGIVTSGSFSPYLLKGIGLGYVKDGFQNAGRRIIIKDEEKVKFEAETVDLPFYKEGSLKK